MKQQASIYWPVSLQRTDVADKGIVIRLVKIEKWTGLGQAAKVLKRTTTQIRRHVSGEQTSAKLAADMEKHGIVVESPAHKEAV